MGPPNRAVDSLLSFVGDECGNGGGRNAESVKREAWCFKKMCSHPWDPDMRFSQREGVSIHAKNRRCHTNKTAFFYWFIISSLLPRLHLHDATIPSKAEICAHGPACDARLSTLAIGSRIHARGGMVFH